MEFEKIQQTKLITTYGAVGSLIETLHNGTLQILEFNQWPYYNYLLNEYTTTIGINLPDQLIVRDERLLYRIKSEMNLNNLERLFRLPENKLGFDRQPVFPQHWIAGRMFPGWFLCPACRTDNLRYHNVLINPVNPKYPHCPHHQYINLDQFPFILVSETGKMCDIPWAEYIAAPANAGVIHFDINNPNCGGSVFSYSSGGSAELLATKTIKVNGGNSKSLARLPSINFISNDVTYKVVSRHGNNVCFIEKFSSVTVPSDIYLPANVRTSINTIYNTLLSIIPNVTAQQIFSTYIIQHPGTNVTIDQIKYHLDYRNNNILDEETKFRSEEYAFFLNNNVFESSDLKFKQYVPILSLFSKILMIDRLKVVHAQKSYSRLKPEGVKVPIYTNPNVRLYPAIEMYGEGIFLFFNLDMLNRYCIEKNIVSSRMLSILHTCVHSLLRELEFHTGYSINSMNERLYFRVLDDNRIVEAGALIYSASTAEGSYGGIASLFEQNMDGELSIYEVIAESLIKAKECSNDPVCITEVLANGSKGVCYACNVLPEITCEQFNQQLDRVGMLAYLEYLNI